jgi:hypothetical protein
MTTTPKLNGDWTLRHIGNIGVDSGFVRVSDTAGNPPVTTQIPEVDGIFPCYRVYAGEEFIGLFVGFELEPPVEGDGKVTLGNLEKA